MRIAIPIENGRLHEHFGGCRSFALVDVDLTGKRALRTETLPAPEHKPGLFPQWLREQGAEVVIAGGIGPRALAIFAAHGIQVRAGIPNGTTDQLIAAYLDGQLVSAPDGCEHHGDHAHHGDSDCGS